MRITNKLFPLFQRCFASTTNPCIVKKQTKKIRVKTASGRVIGEYHEGGYKVFQRIAFFFAFPIIAGLMARLYIMAEEKEREPFVKYEYLRRRTKRFPWGDGNKSLFHNKHTNALPDGYEVEDEE